jgi:hypothetical protein
MVGGQMYIDEATDASLKDLFCHLKLQAEESHEHSHDSR